ncbi:hypothetical protein GGR27_003605 [Lewinella antarctica]|uniref:Uncharacterized protein n=1 Tax=Neolewinella antarctica TaxID=442734 RepID=A0ABX0XGT3_9BACT|nr:hypothetical protein [Neolewinella antarctica]
MDSLFILTLFLSNPIVNEFSSTLNVERLTQRITIEKINHSNLSALSVDNFCIEFSDIQVCGEALLSSSADKRSHLVFFKTHDDTMWNHIESYVMSNFSSIQNMNHVSNAVAPPTFFSFPKFVYNKMSYGISVVRAKDKPLGKNETQIFIKIRVS